MKLICKKIQKLPDISENTPPAIASGIIYFICYLCKLNIQKFQIYVKYLKYTNKCFKIINIC